MQIRVECQPSYSIATAILNTDETIYCESGAMAYMSGGIEVAGSVTGGVLRSALRKGFGDESFFMAKYTARVHGAWVALAPKYPGDIDVIGLDPGEAYFIEAGASLGHAGSVTVDVKYAGMRSIALGEGATVLRASGVGPMIICSYGALQKFTLDHGESIIVDTGHLVAWSASMGMRFGPLSGLVTSQVTGEGLVGELTGPGEVWVQTRAEQSIRNWIMPERLQNSRKK